MSISFRHLLEQGPVVKSLLGAGMEALGQKLRKPSGEWKVPGPWLEATVEARSPRLVVDYIRWTGGDFARYDSSLPPHMFPQWAVPLMAKTLRGCPYPLTKLLNQGCQMTIHAPLPKDRPLQLKARLEGVDDNGHRARLHQRVITGTLEQPEALVCDIYTVVKLQPKGPRTQREKPQIPADAISLPGCDVGPQAGLEFALLTGDFNPIHWIKPAAKAAGFKSTILHGFGALALSLERLNGHLSRTEQPPWKSVDVRFIRPMLLPNTLTLHLASDEEVPQRTRLFLTDQSNEICMLGSFSQAA